MSALGNGPILAAAITPIAGDSSHTIAAKPNHEVLALPTNFPARFTGEKAWTGVQFPDPSRYTLVLAPNEIGELNVAVTHFKCNESPLLTFRHSTILTSFL